MMRHTPNFLSRRRFIVLRVLLAALALGGAVAVLSFPCQAMPAARPGSTLAPGPAIQSFLPIYARYVSAIQAHGLDGFKRETAPGFTVRHGHGHWTGAAAFRQANVWLAGIRGGKAAVTIRRLRVVGGTAFVWTRESLTWPLPPDAAATGAVNLKQVWRQSGGRWRLAVQEWVSGKAVAPSPSVTYTVSAADGSAPTVSVTRHD